MTRSTRSTTELLQIGLEAKTSVLIRQMQSVACPRLVFSLRRHLDAQSPTRVNQATTSRFVCLSRATSGCLFVFFTRRLWARAHYVFFSIDATAFFQISMTTPKIWRKPGVKRNRVNAEEVPAKTPLRLLFLRFLSFDDLDHRSLTHLLRETFNVESISS